MTDYLNVNFVFLRQNLDELCMISHFFQCHFYLRSGWFQETDGCDACRKGSDMSLEIDTHSEPQSAPNGPSAASLRKTQYSAYNTKKYQLEKYCSS